MKMGPEGGAYRRDAVVAVAADVVVVVVVVVVVIIVVIVAVAAAAAAVTVRVGGAAEACAQVRGDGATCSSTYLLSRLGVQCQLWRSMYDHDGW